MQSVAATTRTAKQHKLLHKLNTLAKHTHTRAKSEVHISTSTCKPPWPPPEHANEYAHSLTTLVQHTIQVTTALPNVPTEYIWSVLLPPSFCIRIFLSSYVQKTSAAAVIVVVVSKGGWRGGGGCLLPCFCQTSLSCASTPNAPSQTVFLYCNCQLYLSIVFLYCILLKSSSTNIFLNCVAFDTAALSCNCSYY